MLPGIRLFHAPGLRCFRLQVRTMASLQESFTEAASQAQQHKEPAKHDVSGGGASGDAVRQAQAKKMSGGGEEARAEGEESEEVRGELAEAYEKDMDDYGQAYATRSSDEGFGQIYGEPVTPFGVRGR
ncbi:unnamed protein product [Closterium sp. Yama58-4]|nr:unnamed protein product [Closterium sp. Yama58-4]